MDLNLRQLRAFVSVAHYRSLTRSAETLHQSQPALTVQIRKLEEVLRCKLLDRNCRSVSLARIGRELLPLLRRTLRDLDAVVVDSHGRSAGRIRTVRIASLPSFAASSLPNVILACRKRNEDLSFVVRDAVASRVNQLVRDEEVDLGITGGELLDNELENFHAVQDRLCIVFPADHAIGRRRSIRARDVIEQPLVLTDPATSVRAVVDGAFALLGRTPKVVCESTYMMTAVAMVRAGFGLTILPETAREVIAERGLRSRPIDDPKFTRCVYHVEKRNRSLPPAAQAFLEVCVKVM